MLTAKVSLAAAFSALLTVTLTITLGQSRVVKRSDDVDVQALESLVQQQASALQALQADVTSLSSKVSALSKAGECAQGDGMARLVERR